MDGGATKEHNCQGFQEASSHMEEMNCPQREEAKQDLLFPWGWILLLEKWTLNFFCLTQVITG